MSVLGLGALTLAKRAAGAIGRGLGWLIERPVRLLVAALALVLVWQLMFVAPSLRDDLRGARKAGEVLAGRLVAEKSAHQQTKADYRKAQAEAGRLEQARLARVKAQQQEITDEVVADFERRIADARARAGELRDEALARAGADGAAGGERVPAAGDAAGRTDEAPGDRGFPAAERLIATEQAIQLDELISWVERQFGIEINGDAR